MAPLAPYTLCSERHDSGSHRTLALFRGSSGGESLGDSVGDADGDNIEDVVGYLVTWFVVSMVGMLVAGWLLSLIAMLLRRDPDGDDGNGDDEEKQKLTEKT